MGFQTILPNVPTKVQFATVFIIQALFNLVRTMIRTAGPDLDGLDEYGSYMVIFITAFSFVLAFAMSIQNLTLGISAIDRKLQPEHGSAVNEGSNEDQEDGKISSSKAPMIKQNSD